MPSQAILDSYSLPYQFSYDPGIPQKRINIVESTDSVVIQKAATMVAQDTFIKWNCPACCESEWEAIFDKYNQASDPIMAFTGYWGDIYTVRFHALDSTRVRSILFDLTGQFQILSVASWH